jgi:hypothetical protein
VEHEHLPKAVGLRLTRERRSECGDRGEIVTPQTLDDGVVELP